MKRKLWVLEGILLHKLNPDILIKIADKFEKIDVVPVDYFYPEFFAKQEEMIAAEESIMGGAQK